MDYIGQLKEFTIGTENGRIPLILYMDEQFNKINWFSNKNAAYDIFEQNLIILRAIFFVIIIAMAIYYPIKFETTGIIKKKPLLFCVESIFVGVCTMVPFLMLVILRNKRYTAKEIMKYCILLFIVFFILNYLLELSGFYEYSFSENKQKTNISNIQPDDIYISHSEKILNTIDNLLRTVFFLMIALSIIVLIVTIILVRDTNLNYNITGINKWIIFIFESALFGAISAVPIYFIASNREALDPKKTSKEFLLIMFKFMLLNMILQFSGFYNHIFIDNYHY